MTRVPFPKPLRVELLPNGSTPRRVFRLLAIFAYVRTNGERIYTPIDCEVDGASIPWFWWRLIGPPWGVYAEASVIHDHLWMDARKWAQDAREKALGNWQGVARNKYEHANRVFDEALRDCGVTNWRRVLMVWCVRRWARQELRRLVRGEVIR